MLGMVADQAPAAHRRLVTLKEPSPRARAIKATAFIFDDPASCALADRIGKVAPSDATVLIVGETGTGKELIAREVHRRSARATRPFVAINCAALPEHIVESELFGHERGAFTGADARKIGWFETASGGTLFLDEIGDLPLSLQVKLLRVLQEREINRVGSRVPIPIDVRFIAATNANLEEDVRAGRFREDLYYRLNVARLNVAALRDRPGDIVPLAQHFLERFSPGARFSAAAEAALRRHDWPGNIRELENVVQQALLVAAGSVVDVGDLDLAGAIRAASEQDDALETALDALASANMGNLHAALEQRLLRYALNRTSANQVHAAQLLGISRNILRNRMKIHGLL